MSKEQINQKIIDLLNQYRIGYRLFEHQEEKDSVKMAQELGICLNQAVKSLLLCGKKSAKHFLLCLLGDQKVNIKAFSQHIKEPCEFEKIDLIKNEFGLDIGCIPPFGFLLSSDIPTYFDTSIKNSSQLIIGSGFSTQSIQIDAKDLITLTKPLFLKISKDLSI